MARLFVARHGETNWNRAGRYQGRSESELTQTGVRQAQALASSLASSGARRLFSSPLRRCKDTAGAIATRIDVPITVDARLAEIAHGTWEGRLREQIERDDSQRMYAWRTAPETVQFEGGESLADVEMRWNDFLASLDPSEDAVAVTHDVVVRLAILSATNRRCKDLWMPRVCNGGYAVLSLERHGTMRRLRLLEECHDAHLGDFLVDPRAQAL